jgi:streptogramin lyase
MVGLAATPSSGPAAMPAATTITLERVSGTVFVKRPNDATFSSLAGRRSVPEGTEVDAAAGRVRVRASTGQNGVFYEGRFMIRVPRAGTVDLELTGSSFTSCAKGRQLASIQAEDQPPRRLWGSGRGKFRTRGRYSVVSVRGTVWLTSDSCQGTITRVRQGVIQVADLLRGRQVIVRRGKTYRSNAPVEYAIPTEDSQPISIAAGRDGNLWFTQIGSGSIGRSTRSGSIIEFPVPRLEPGDDDGSSTPEVIVTGPDGNLWFTDPGQGAIGRLTPAGTFTMFAVSGTPHGLTVGPDNNLWFTDDEAIGRMTTTGSVTRFPLQIEVGGDATRITAGAEGNLWFIETTGNKIGRITLAGAVTEFDIPTEDSGPAEITAGPDGNVWFTESLSGKVGRITPSGKIDEYELPSGAHSGPQGITAGADRNLWVAESGSSMIARVTPAGRITEVPTPTDDAEPYAITAGLGGPLWFTEIGANAIACARC